MIYTIENEFLRVSAEDDGAQLSSVELKENGKEFLWQGDPSVWYGRAPVLFPIIGQLLDGKYRYSGRANMRCRSTASRATRCLLSKSRAKIP